MTRMDNLMPNDRIFMFFGSEVSSLDIVHDSAKAGWRLMPMDLSAREVVCQLGVDFLSWDDVVSAIDRKAVLVDAGRYENTWWKGSEQAFTVDDVCWPDFDRHAMQWFWQQVCLAGTFATRLLEAKVERVRLFHPIKSTPAVYYEKSHVFHAVLSQHLQIDWIYSETETKRNNKMLAWVLSRVRWRMHSAKSKLEPLLDSLGISARVNNADDLSDIANKIVIAVNPGEVFRFSHIFTEVWDQYGQGSALMLLTRSKERLQDIMKKSSMPVYPMPQSLVIPDLSDLFLKAFRDFSDTVDINAELRDFMKVLPFHFDYYCTYRWPSLIAQYEGWIELFKLERPAAVIVSALPDAESQLPAAAARELGISSISIPHGGVQGGNNIISAQTILCPNELQRQLWHKAGVDNERLCICRELLPTDEYPSHSIEPAETCTRSKILVLTYPLGFDGHALLKSIDKQIRGLQTLSTIPDQLKRLLDVVFKPNPKYPDLFLFKCAGINGTDSLLPQSASLESILDTVDFVVMLNCAATAAANVIQAGKPIIFLWNDPVIENLKTTGIFTEAGPVIRNEVEFWDVTIKYFTDADYAKTLREQSASFYQKYLYSSGYPTVSEVINEMLQNNLA